MAKSTDPKQSNPWRLRSKEIRYQNPWISIEHHDVLKPNDEPGIYGVVRFANLAIGIVTRDEHGNTTLVGQWRYPLGQYSWEIPEGGCPIHQDPLLTAQRELLEETGLSAKRWTKLLDLHLSNSVTDEAGFIYLAEELSQGEAEPEDTEVLLLRKLPFDEAVEMVIRAEITDAVTVAGLLAADRFLRKRAG